MKVCVIPARGGSKRIPRKNIKDFAGQPMIAYAIQAALQSGMFDRVVVSTDDDEVAAVAQTHGADLPFMRPAALADDYATTASVMVHAIAMLEREGAVLSQICCIYPCVPLLQVSDLQRAFELMQQHDSDYSFPVAAFPSAIQRALRQCEGGKMQPFHPEYQSTRTQDLEPAYYDAGMFYWGKKEAWLNNPLMHQSGVGLVIPAWRVVDVDTEEDWQRALQLYAACPSV